MTDRPESNRAGDLTELLRSCIGCGLCQTHCATYLATGNELLSPRGRLQLLKELLEGDQTVEVGALQAFDRCLGCLACQTACPSGVSSELLEEARRLAGIARVAPLPLPAPLLDTVSGLTLLRRTGGSMRSLLRMHSGDRWRLRLERGPEPVRMLGRLLGSLPMGPGRDSDLGRLLGVPDPGRRTEKELLSGPTVAFFRGCAGQGLLPETGRRTRQLLEAAGCRVLDVKGEVCCGAMATHAGNKRRASDLRAANEIALTALPAGTQHIVVESAGCGLELSGYPAAIADLVVDAVVLLSRLELPPPRPLPLRVVVHDPCHSLHGRRIMAEPRDLLGRIPELEIVEAREGDVCCGSAGPYSLRHRRLSAAMGRRKAEMLAAARADVVVTTNPGCLGQIADGLALVAPNLPILPLTDLLWAAHIW